MRGIIRRSKARGGIVVEAMVVFLILALLCVFGAYAWRLYENKVALLRQVREPVWASATFACGSPGKTFASYPSGGGARVSAGEAPAIDGTNFTLIPANIPGGPGIDVLDRTIGIGSTSSSRAVAGHRLLGAPAQTFQGGARMMCNEPVEDGELPILKNIAARNFPHLGTAPPIPPVPAPKPPVTVELTQIFEKINACIPLSEAEQKLLDDLAAQYIPPSFGVYLGWQRRERTVDAEKVFGPLKISIGAKTEGYEIGVTTGDGFYVQQSTVVEAAAALDLGAAEVSITICAQGAVKVSQKNQVGVVPPGCFNVKISRQIGTDKFNVGIYGELGVDSDGNVTFKVGGSTSFTIPFIGTFDANGGVVFEFPKSPEGAAYAVFLKKLQGCIRTGFAAPECRQLRARYTQQGVPLPVCK